VLPPRVMRLYHVSTQKFDDVLSPVVGPRRHGGEDRRAVGNPVIWLTNDPTMKAESPEGTIDRYQHEVEIPENDPHLFLDTDFDVFMSDTMSTMRWYFYTGTLKVVRVREYDPAKGQYL
jgi:hypothetical protein